MARIVLFVIIGLIVWGLFRGFGRSRVTRDEAATRRAATEDMVACARCGVHMPMSEAKIDAGSFYCRDNPRCTAAG
ncbi:MAG TPA: PP0621 family protein [Usitatibacter sp.]|nr:PP0621 family protein [Usitatibacter sp.]